MRFTYLLVLIVALVVTVPIMGHVSDLAFAQYMGDLKDPTAFHETIQVLVDRTSAQNITASVTLQSTSIDDLRIPHTLEKHLRDDDRILAVVLTTHDQCILGVLNQMCVIINMERSADDRGITTTQNSAKETATRHIDSINQAFDTDAEFHSVFVHSGTANQEQAPGMPDLVAGRSTVSVVYTMPMVDTSSMYTKISDMLLLTDIQNAGGFYTLAKEISDKPNSVMSFSIVPASDTKSLLQLKVTSSLPVNANMSSNIDILDVLGIDSLDRSGTFWWYPPFQFFGTGDSCI